MRPNRGAFYLSLLLIASCSFSIALERNDDRLANDPFALQEKRTRFLKGKGKGKGTSSEHSKGEGKGKSKGGKGGKKASSSSGKGGKKHSGKGKGKGEGSPSKMPHSSPGKEKKSKKGMYSACQSVSGEYISCVSNTSSK